MFTDATKEHYYKNHYMNTRILPRPEALLEPAAPFVAINQ